MLNAEEVERIIREYATPDDELGWPGDQAIMDQAEGIAAFIADNYAYRPA